MASLRSGPIAPGIAFVTGGARGLGNAIAVSFAREGSKGIALVDIQDEKTFEQGKAAVTKYGTKCITIHADVTKEDQVERAIAEAVKEFGRIDYAANFAGILGPVTPATETPLESWKNLMDVNLMGVWLCVKHQLKQMMQQNSVDVEEGRVPQLGSIVNAASVMSIQGSAGTGAYTAAKHGVVGITKSAALEAREHNIRVNAVSPGFLMTDLLKPFLAAGKIPADSWPHYEARQGRSASFDEVGDVVVLLSTPRMSLVNGHNLVIDGGFTINGAA
ncbi:NAD(P)-binding protein [Sphaerulina musiva SO2202]|uniref:NAD(P)-binding protein n=1 Tax=Sphaerulina musiva (strain SO2202) TaxID=692275 RepID=M3D9C9_SPHMS|nr:NAD(P)-binding protein [Sphaerulina musiva SO2202]EMF14484.1 NAD(P)-binding protein [Sphaerulina musiva SO2202]